MKKSRWFLMSLNGEDRKINTKHLLGKRASGISWCVQHRVKRKERFKDNGKWLNCEVIH